MKLLVQNYLQSHSLSELERDHGAYFNASKDFKKIILNYSQIESKESDPLACECRGLILSKINYSEFTNDKNKLYLNAVVGETSIISFPMQRFFNFGQGSTKINLNDPDLKLFEKVDGSVIIFYFCPISNSWQCSTRGVSEADQIVFGSMSDITYRELVELTLTKNNLSFDQLTNYMDKAKTYVFELCTPQNPVTVKYDNYSLILLAVRNLNSLKECLPEEERIVKELNIYVPESYPFSSMDDLISWVSDRDPTKYEGVILRDSNFNRIKIKSPSHVALSRIKDNILSSERNCLELILAEKDDDVVPLLHPDIANKVIEMKSSLIQMMKFYDNLYLECYNEAQNNKANCKKTFANTIVIKDVWTAPLFQIYDNKAKSTKEFIFINKKEGTWKNSFIDRILQELKNFSK